MTTNEKYSISGKLQIFETYAPWVYLPIRYQDLPNVNPGGWGSIPVNVTIGPTSWRTSLFPLKKEGYFLPVKKQILKKENLKVGDKINATYILA